MADDDNFFAMSPPNEAPPAVPDGAPILLAGPSENSSNYVGDVDETPPYQSFEESPHQDDDDPYAAFGEPPTSDDNPYQVFGQGPSDSEDLGFASSDRDAPIILGPPSDDDANFGETQVESTEEEEEEPVVHEPSPMQKWNEEFQETLNQRREAENAKRSEQVEAARKAMEEFNASRETRRDARMAKNRQDEQAKLEAIEADLENDNSWQRVCKMVELTHDSTKEAADLKRMRDVLIHLKNDPTRAQALS